MFGRRSLLSIIALVVLLSSVLTLTGCCGLLSAERWGLLSEARPTATLQARETSVPPQNTTPVPTATVAAPVEHDPMSLVELYELANPAVVNIAVASVVRGDGLFQSDPGAQQYRQGVGSGFVFDNQGHIVTNNHVVQGADLVRVTFVDDFTVPAAVVGTDPDSDLAVIRVDVDAEHLHPLLLADSDEVRPGLEVVAIGNPFGLRGTMTHGIVSAIGRLLPVGESQEADAQYTIPDIIQTDAAINPGNSGGPLLDLRGRVIGVNTAITGTTGAFSGVGFVVPSSIVRQVVPALIENGFYQHPWLGITTLTLSPVVNAEMNLPEDQRGVMVAAVTRRSPADKAGLRGATQSIEVFGQDFPTGGDIIVRIDDQPVRVFDDLISYLVRRTQVGQTVTLGILRDDEAMEVEVTLEARPTGQTS